MNRVFAALASATWLLLVAACAPVPPAPVGLLDVSARPAEKALLAGLKAYDDAQYDSAQQLFRQALALGLASRKDRAEAHKRLAFIECAAGRLGECEGEFRLARQADPAFALDRSEAGHPVWGPVYRKVVPP
ncbi:MAG TPA: TssQ family T6SS-associated lipoprotein [Caldimonas sp.]|nr:TssQ family T6SS-associated lipoprotein [Caldimonas sp.]